MSEDLSVKQSEYHGNSGIILEDPGTLHEDRTGLATCTAVWVTRRANWGSFPKINTAHPIFGYIGIESRSISFKGAFARCECNYAGIDANETEPVYELVVGLSEDPIDTHVDFVTKIGGKPSSPLHGAVFKHIKTGAKFYTGAVAPGDDGYVFDSFMLLIGSDKNPYAKVETYMEASCMTWKKSWNKRLDNNDISKVGHIDTPDGRPPSLKSPANWLNMGVTLTKRGTCYAATQEWRASGRAGWLREVYE